MAPATKSVKKGAAPAATTKAAPTKSAVTKSAAKGIFLFILIFRVIQCFYIIFNFFRQEVCSQSCRCQKKSSEGEESYSQKENPHLSSFLPAKHLKIGSCSKISLQIGAHS